MTFKMRKIHQFYFLIRSGIQTTIYKFFAVKSEAKILSSGVTYVQADNSIPFDVEISGSSTSGLDKPYMY